MPNDSPALQATLNGFVPNGYGALDLAAGDIHIGTRLTAGDTALSVNGRGMGVTRLLVENVNGFLNFLYDAQRDRAGAITLRDLDIVAATGGDAGVAVNVEFSNLWAPGVQPKWGGINQVSYKNVRLMSRTKDDSVENFATGLRLRNVFGSVIESASLGVSHLHQNARTNWIDIQNTKNADQVSFGGTYSVKISKSEIMDGARGIIARGWIEGISVSAGTQLVGQTIGIDVDGNGACPEGKPPPGLWVHASHINSKAQAILALKWAAIQIEGSDVFKGVGQGTDQVSDVAGFSECEEVMLIGNKVDQSQAFGPTNMLNFHRCKGVTVATNRIRRQGAGPSGVAVWGNAAGQSKDTAIIGNRFNLPGVGGAAVYGSLAEDWEVIGNSGVVPRDANNALVGINVGSGQAPGQASNIWR